MIKRRYIEAENASIIDSSDMVKEVEPAIEDNSNSLPPQLQYKPDEDPEYNKKAITEAFWRGYNSENKLNESGPSILSYIKDYIKKNGNANLNDIAASLPEDGGSMSWYKKHLDELQKRINKVLVGSGSELGNAAENIDKPQEFDSSRLTNDLAKELVSGSSAVSEVMSATDSANDKFDTIYSIARTILTGRGIKHHGFIYGAAGVGKTYSVKQAIKYEFPKGALAHKGYQIEFNSGDIGRSASAIVAFFYKNRSNKVIVLDDCDAFLLSTDQAIQNLLKAMLDLDNTEKNPKYISVSPTIRKLASKLIQADDDKLDEGVEVSIDEKRLREGMLTISVNGKVAYDEEATDEDLKTFRIKESKKAKSSSNFDSEAYFGLGLYNESLDDDLDLTDLDDGSIEDADELKELSNEEDEGIPPKWRFTSRLMMISNLKKDQLNEAVLSRTLSYGLFLTKDEFMARLAQILPNLLTDVETEASAHMVNYAKKVAYAYLLAAVDIANNGGSVGGKAVVISPAALQFRLIAELAGKWMQRVDNYMIKNSIEDESDETLNDINNQIKYNFFMFDVIPSLKI